MPEISLLQPDVLNGFIRRKPFPQNLLGLQLMGVREPYPFPTWKYDIVSGNLRVSKPNTPNGEAHIVDQMGVGSITGSFIYMRDKKNFEPTTLHWLREVGQYAQSMAEAKVTREVADLDNRIERFVEWTVWQMLTTGTLVVHRPDAPWVNVDFQVDSTHKVTLSGANRWIAAPTTADIPAQFASYKQTFLQDAAMPLTTVYLNSTTFNTGVLANSKIQSLLSPMMKEEYLKTGTLDGLLGVKWVTYDLTYTDDWTTPGTQTSVKYLADGKAVLVADDPEAYGLMEGPSADDDAPDGHIGKFSKSWRQNDPSTRTVLEEYPFIPILKRPDNLMILTTN